MWRGKLFSKTTIFSNKDFHTLFSLSESIIIKNVKAFLCANDGRQVNTTSSLFVCIFKLQCISKNNQKQIWQDQYLSKQNAKERKAIRFFFSVYRRPTDPNFWHFQKKNNDVVTPFFTWNNSFNLKNEHSNSIEKNRNKNMNIFHSILYILLIQICEC